MTPRKAQSDMDTAYKRLTDGLSALDGQPAPGPARVRTIRDNLTQHLTLLASNIEGRATKCGRHPTEFAHNCGPCRSEQLATPALPETPEAAREIDARILGERIEVTAVIHIAGPLIAIGHYRRQRCAWCGAVLGDHDLTRIAVPEGQPFEPPCWPEGDLIAIDGNATWVVKHEHGQLLPDGACGKLDPAVTA
jgi:hypothetical protein